MFSLIALLSKYDLFHVITSDGEEFNAAELKEHHGFFEFRKWFASTIYSNDVIIDIHAINFNEFVCTTRNLKTYRIIALQERPKASEPLHSDFEIKSIFDLLDIRFIDKLLVQYQNDLNMLMLPVSPYQLGILTHSQYFKIKRIIDTELSGLSEHLQFNRTVCFYCKKADTYRQIYAGIYNLEINRPVTVRFIYDSRLMPQPNTILNRINEIFEFYNDLMNF